jgi:hypothetical protein
MVEPIFDQRSRRGGALPSVVPADNEKVVWKRIQTLVLGWGQIGHQTKDRFPRGGSWFRFFPSAGRSWKPLLHSGRPGGRVGRPEPSRISPRVLEGALRPFSAQNNIGG